MCELTQFSTRSNHDALFYVVSYQTVSVLFREYTNNDLC